MTTLHRAKQLQDKTKTFAIRVIKAFARLPKEEATRIVGRQFLRSGTSVAANYRAACRSRSAGDFISKISIVAEEADEPLFGLELLLESELIQPAILQSLMRKCEELLKIHRLRSQPQSAIAKSLTRLTR